RSSDLDDRRAAVEAHDGGEGRLDAGIAALAFQRFHQRRFFAALVGARARVNQQVEVEPGAKNVVPKITARVGFGDGGIHDVQNVAVFAANVDETAMRIDGAPGNDDPLDQ